MSASPFSEPTHLRRDEYNLFGSIRRRILASIAATAGWLTFVLLFLAFWAGGFTIFQDIVVAVVSLIVLAGILLGSWISFGLRFAGA